MSTHTPDFLDIADRAFSAADQILRIAQTSDDPNKSELRQHVLDLCRYANELRSFIDEPVTQIKATPHQGRTIIAVKLDTALVEQIKDALPNSGFNSLEDAVADLVADAITGDSSRWVEDISWFPCYNQDDEIAEQLPSRITSRDCLSFTSRVEHGRLDNWAVSHKRDGYWSERVEIGKGYFSEIEELAKHSEREAVNAILYAICSPKFRGGYGEEFGFSEALSRVVILGLRAIRNGADTFIDTTEPDDGGADDDQSI